MGKIEVKTRLLGKTDFAITALGIGAWAMGGGNWAYGWGPQDDRDSIEAIRHAIDAGVNWIDTAAVYGLGHSEEIVGRALEGIYPRPFIFTKCGMSWDDSGKITRCLKAESIRREIEHSLRRLRVETIDLYQIHWPEPEKELEEAWTTLRELQIEGKIRQIGVSNFNVDQMKRAEAIAPIASLQPPYSLIVRGIEKEVLPYAARHKIGVISYSPLKSGLLSGSMSRERIAALPSSDFRRSTRDFREPQLSRNLALVEVLRSIGREHECSAGEVAIAWVLKNPSISGAIVGVRSASQVTGVIRAAQIQLSPENNAALEGFAEGIGPALIERVLAKTRHFGARLFGH